MFPIRDTTGIPSLFSLLASLSGLVLVALPFLMMIVYKGPMDWNLITETCSFAGLGIGAAGIYKGWKAFPAGGTQRLLGVLGILFSLAAIYLLLAAVYMTYLDRNARL